MNRATRIVATVFGAFAGFGGIEHGVFEVMQGNVAPAGLMISSMGSPCQPEEVWHACEPAMTVVPSFLVTGILSIILGIITIIWSIGFVHKKHGGLVLMMLSTALLLVGGGIFPPVIGIVGGAVGTKIDKPLTWWRDRLSGRSLPFLARLWPWPLVIFLVWLAAQWLIGHFFNDFLLQSGMLIPLVIICLLMLSVVVAYANDIYQRELEPA